MGGRFTIAGGRVNQATPAGQQLHHLPLPLRGLQRLALDAAAAGVRQVFT